MEKLSRKRNRYVTLLLGCVAVLSGGPVRAQEDQSQPEAIALPSVSVTSTRLLPAPRRAPSRSSTQAPARAPARAPGPAAAPGEGEGTSAEAVSSSGVVSGTIITGASSSIITSADIERSPSATLQDILAREPGIQTRSLFGGVNGAQTTVDMRGFGASGVSNTLVLVNGRRLNDIDMAGVDFSAIPKNSIERIEITRGNSGAVLYGDGAVGGVINIITKVGVGLPPSARIQGTFGSYHYVEGNVSATSASTSSGNWATSAYANAVSAHGYRDNNQLRQENAVGDLRWNNGQGTSAYLNLSGDNQHNGLPGGLRVSPTFNQLLIDPRAAATPFDFANKEGVNATLGVSHVLWQGTELIVDGGIRQKNQQAAFFCGAFCSDFDRGFKATLTAVSFTPRLTSQHNLGGMAGKLITGIDFYDTTYGNDRSLHLNDPPIHRYDLTQQTAAGYLQETLAVLPTTDFAFGGRVQSNNTTARDKLDLTTPGALFPDPQGLPLDQTETQYAWHVGLEHRLNDNFAVFGRAARSFRLPTVDERVGMAPSGFNVPTNFDLKTQTSHDVEGGARLTYGAFTLQSSVYEMELTDELFFSPATFTNINLDPTRRYGFENIAAWNATEALRFKAGLAYTRSVFREGPFAGNDVPLVSRWTGSAGVSWDVYKKYFTFDAVARVFGPRRMDNDSANLQVEIPGQTLIDLRIGGEYQNVFWSLSVQNLFDVHYFEYAVSSVDFITNLPVVGTYNAYPLPGRTVMAKAGMTW
jgi:iron complex outermembrane receptor protein